MEQAIRLPQSKCFQQFKLIIEKKRIRTEYCHVISLNSFLPHLVTCLYLEIASLIVLCLKNPFRNANVHISNNSKNVMLLIFRHIHNAKIVSSKQDHFKNLSSLL